MLSLLRASHFGPTFAVTLVSFLLAVSLWWEGPAYVIAFGVFLGQLLVGWSNDLNDYQDDLKHNRVNKPLVSGQLSTKKLKLAIKIVAPMALVFNLFGPLGLREAAFTYLELVWVWHITSTSNQLCFHHCRTRLAFAALVSSIVIATDQAVPIWLIACRNKRQYLVLRPTLLMCLRI